MSKRRTSRPHNGSGFFESEPVTRTRSGVEKSPLSVAKTRRVLRQALLFAVSEERIEKAPLPEKM